MVVKYAKQFTCPQCEWTIRSMTGDDNILKHFMVHQQQMHPNDKYDEKEIKGMMKDFYLAKEINCPNCEWSLSGDDTEENLMRHLMIHGSDFHPDEKWEPLNLKPLIKEVHMENMERKKK